MNKSFGFIAVVFLAVTAFFFFKKWSSLESTVLNFIPQETLLVVSSSQIQEKSTLSKVPILQQSQETLLLLKKAIPNDSLIQAFVAHKNITYSLTLETQNNLHFITYIPINTKDDAFLKYLTDLSTQTQGIRSLSHSFENQDITEVFDDKAQSIFTYLIHANTLIMSQSGVLMEDVARQIASQNLISFATNESLKKDSTLIFWNKRLIAKLTRRVFDTKTILSEAIPPLMQCKQAEAVYGMVEASKDYFLNTLTQTQTALTNAKMITNNTATLEKFSIGNGEQFGKKLANYLKKYDDNALKIRSENSSDLVYDKLYPLLDQEINLCQLETVDNSPEKILLLKGLENQSLGKFFQIEAAKLHSTTQVESEKVSMNGYWVEKINVSNYPASLFGDYFMGFEECFFVAINEYVAMANSRQAMQSYLTELANNNVWSNSVKHNKLSQKFVPNSYMLLCDASKSWNSIRNAAISTWANQLLVLEPLLKNTGVLLVQTSQNQHIDNWKTTIQWFNTGVEKSAFANQIVRMAGVYMEATPATQPIFIKDFGAKEAFIFYQDLQKNAVIANLKGKVIWKSKLNSSILSDVKAVNFLNSGHVELLFTTVSQANLLVFNPKDIQLYPFKSSDNLSIRQFIPSDAFNTEERTMFLAAPNRRIYQLKKEGQVLTKLQEKGNTINFVNNVTYFNWQGKGFFAGIKDNGYLDVYSIFGNTLKKFPVQLNGRFDSPLLVQIANNDFQLKALEKQGLLTTVNAKGQTIEQLQLLRSSKGSTFEFLQDQNQQDWLVLSKNEGYIEIMDKLGNQLFSIQNLYTYQNPKFQFINFSPEFQLIALKTNTETRLFTLKGEPLGNKILQSDFPVKIQFSESYNKWIIYTFNDKIMDIWSLKVQ